ncbi:ATP-dependent Clp protease proteolytic subunit [Burkholderia ubonensis]|uniref:ATP-dependent Clp protease proteolytic subunit n=1 Tax=Burkholderia ubonensis TaxID=101571 RepID=UPI000759EAE2|nr:ATP-dependent Clp protease proteolytic subunit [Burkholderia ubonensis]KVP40064.1 hypothetical protein WJ87_07735 [Burkholderia ubonensis]
MTKQKRQNLAESMDDMEEALEVGGVPPLQVFTTSKVKNEYSIYLSNPVVEPAAYDEVCHLLRSVTENDEVKLYLNTPGGALISGLALIQAMRDSKATITTILNPQAFSMGALLFLCGDVRVAPPNSLLMFHHYSGGLSGKGNEQVLELSATNAWFEEAMHNTCSPFLTKKEIRDVLQGKDLWMGSAEINKRLQELKKATRK